jgi:hypothetical protein
MVDMTIETRHAAALEIVEVSWAAEFKVCCRRNNLPVPRLEQIF